MQYRIWSIFCLFCLAMAEAVGNEAVGKDIRNERRRRNYQKLKRINEEKALQEIKKRRFKEEWSSLASTRNKSARYRLRMAKSMADTA